MKLIVIRHGETDYNANSRIQGWTNSVLTQKGKEQIKETAVKLKDMNIDLIIASDLIRTKNTAEIIQEELNVPILFNWLLRERSLGVLEGKSNKKIDWQKYDDDKLEESGIESRAKMLERAKMFLKTISVLPIKTDTILLVTHGGMLNALSKLLVDGFEHRSFKNGEIIELEFKGGEVV